jgi:hypothetical protein
MRTIWCAHIRRKPRKAVFEVADRGTVDRGKVALDFRKVALEYGECGLDKVWQRLHLFKQGVGQSLNHACKHVYTSQTIIRESSSEIARVNKNSTNR